MNIKKKLKQQQSNIIQPNKLTTANTTTPAECYGIEGWPKLIKSAK